ncbi:MAG: hypothetical protein IKN55_04155 [Oscillospiraceae bacterium]|nr:hypothetical protein [Oscillospiraceae bacterium]
MNMTKITAFMTAIAMTAGMPALPAQAESSSADIFSYSIYDTSVTITGLVPETAPSKLVIPDTIEGKPVTGILEYAFAGHSEIMDISIPDSVYYIGSQAFAGTRWYQTQPAGLVYAGNVVIAWKGRNKPDVIRLREGTTAIGAFAFSEGCGVQFEFSMTDRYFQTVPIIVPKSLKYIDHLYYMSDESLTDSWLHPGNIYYEGTEEEWNRVLINGTPIGEYKYPAVLYHVYFESTEPDHEPFISAPFEPGDVYPDEKVDLLDVITLNRHLMMGEFVFPQRIAAADVNQNGVPDETDALMILKSVLGVEKLTAFTPEIDPKNEFYQNGYNLYNETADLLNHAALSPHLEYDIYEGKKEDGKVYQHIKLRDEDIATLDAFAAAHFSDENTNAEKLYVTHQWIHYTNRYAYAGDLWDQIVAKTYVDAIFNYQLGQCIQYNGAMAGMLAYMGYDVWMEGTPGVHWTTYVEIDGKVYNIECGNYGKNGEWQAFFGLVER